EARKEGQIGRVVQLLRSVIPEGPDQEDLRGFEWYHLWRQYHGEHSRLRGHTGAVTAIQFSPADRLIASAAADETIRIWDPKTGKETQCLKGHKGRVTSIAFSPDGKSLVSAGSDSEVRLWDIATGQSMHTFCGHQGAVHCLAFHPNGRLIASGSAD